MGSSALYFQGRYQGGQHFFRKTVKGVEADAKTGLVSLLPGVSDLPFYGETFKLTIGQLQVHKICPGAIQKGAVVNSAETSLFIDIENCPFQVGLFQVYLDGEKTVHSFLGPDIAAFHLFGVFQEKKVIWILESPDDMGVKTKNIVGQNIFNLQVLPIHQTVVTPVLVGNLYNEVFSHLHADEFTCDTPVRIFWFKEQGGSQFYK